MATDWGAHFERLAAEREGRTLDGAERPAAADGPVASGLREDDDDAWLEAIMRTGDPFGPLAGN